MQKEEEGAESLFTLFLRHKERKNKSYTDVTTPKKEQQKLSSKFVHFVYF
jgi:hypothetical protein